jgi:hypothetical protein
MGAPPGLHVRADPAIPGPDTVARVLRLDPERWWVVALNWATADHEYPPLGLVEVTGYTLDQSIASHLETMRQVVSGSNDTLPVTAFKTLGPWDMLIGLIPTRSDGYRELIAIERPVRLRVLERVIVSDAP